MSQLFTRDEICRTTGADAQNLSANSISSISIDSRTLGDNSLYVAIRGERFDGHDFVRNAIEAGAVAALVSEEKANKLSGLPLFVVRDALGALGDLARFARQRSTAKIIAVTGSVGKTTTKQALETVLSSFGETYASIKSYNNHWGVPLMLAGLPSGADFGVFEMGMNHSGEITPLSQMVRPDIAVITAIAPAHIGFLGSIEAIARAKAEIFDGMRPGGLAIINADHVQLDILLAAAAQAELRVRTFGYDLGADIVISDYAATQEGASAVLNLDGGFRLKLPVPGKHMISNAAAAALVAEALQLHLQKAVDSLGQFSASAGRGRVELLGPVEQPLMLIDESYNANPASMKAALEVFSDRTAPSGRKLLVLGDMRELGGQSKALHLSLEQAICDSGADEIFLVGAEIQVLAERISAVIPIGGQSENAAGIEDVLLNSLAAGDAVMLKASLGTGLGALVASIHNRFNRDA